MKDKISNLFDKMNPFFDKVSNNVYLQAISGAMMSTLAPIFIGSISLLLLIFGSNVEFLQNNPAILQTLSQVNSVTIGGLSLYLSVTIAASLVSRMKPGENVVTPAIISLMSFLIITPLDTVDEASVIPMNWLGAQGVFSAMIIGLSVARIYIAIKNQGWTIKMPEGVPSMVTAMMEGLIPAVLIGLIVIMVNILFALTSFGNMHEFIYTIIQKPLQGVGGSLGAMIALSLLQQILWFFGIHGTNVIMPIVTPIWLALDVQNMETIAAGGTPENIIGLAFFNIVTWGGTALGLTLLMLRAKSQMYRQIGKVSIVPALFGITEPAIFGTPLVLNFRLMVPFITNNTIAIILSYFLTRIGIVDIFPGVQAIFGLPLGFYAAIQGSLSIILLHLFIQLILSPILWFPWFRALDREQYLIEQEAAKKQ